MTQLSLQIPQLLSLNSTEDPKIASDLTAIQNVVNSLDASNVNPTNSGIALTSRNLSDVGNVPTARNNLGLTAPCILGLTANYTVTSTNAWNVVATNSVAYDSEAHSFNNGTFTLFVAPAAGVYQCIGTIQTAAPASAVLLGVGFGVGASSGGAIPGPYLVSQYRGLTIGDSIGITLSTNVSVTAGTYINLCVYDGCASVMQVGTGSQLSVQRVN